MEDPAIRATRTNRSVGWFIGLCLLFILAACAGSGDDASPPPSKSTSGQVETLSSDAALETYLKDQFARSVNADMGGYYGDLENGGDGGRPADDSADGASAPGEADYSQTNIQESGVDESDVIKTDGSFFYVASGNTFRVVEITGTMREVATVTVSGQVDELFLYGDKLVVLYSANQADVEPWVVQPPVDGRLFGMPYWLPIQTRQGVGVYDISDPRTPTPLRMIEIDGYLVSSRLIQGKLHLVQQFVPRLPPMEYWYDGSQRDLEETIEANREAIADMSLAQLIPHFREVEDASDATAQSETPLVAPERFYCPVSKNGGGTITTVVTFDLEDPSLPFTSAGIVADAHIVYASPNSLYTATHKLLYDATVDTEASEETTLFKFDLTAEGVQYVGGGVIPGWILNQFSLGEYESVLRVATTTGHAGGWGPTSSNQVYCLELEGETLKVIGKIEGMAPGEQIYAARFMGERGYLVTFVNIDPLFTLDLSDPTEPRVAGELKVPGFSDYIHPYGDDYLITVGKDALMVEEDNFAWYQGVQLSIFDVRDFSNPVLLHKELLGDRGTSSEASYNHKAFTFWPAQELLALPIDLREHTSPPEQPWEYGEPTFRGLYVYRLSAEGGFNLLGRISTESDEDGQRWGHSWIRGAFVEDKVYALTDNAIRSATVHQLEGDVQTLYFSP